MSDLVALGAELRRRRKAQGLSSAELARRIGVSPTYVWLIEGAKPRPSSGEPSRPSEDVLHRWAAALDTAEYEQERIRELAGYSGPARLRRAPLYSPPMAPPALREPDRPDIRAHSALARPWQGQYMHSRAFSNDA